MKKQTLIFSLIFNIFSIFIFFSDDIDSVHTTASDNRIYVNYFFNNKTIFNNEFILNIEFDSQDQKDNTTDKNTDIKLNKNIKIEKDINKISYFKNLFKKSFLYIQKQLFQNFNHKKIDFQLYQFDENLIEDIRETDYILDIYIEKYNEGEFNLIKNKNCEIGYFVTLKKNGSKVNELKKKYSLRTNSDYPLEIIRLEKINEMLVSDILKFDIFKKNNTKKEVITGKKNSKQNKDKKNSDKIKKVKNNSDDATSDKNLK